MVQTDLLGFVFAMHSGLCEQYVQIPRPYGLGIGFPAHTSASALWQQTLQNRSKFFNSISQGYQSWWQWPRFNMIIMFIQVEWDECWLIIGTSCLVQVFGVILDSLVGLSVGIQSAGDLVSETLGSNPAFNRGKQRVFFWFKYRLPVPEHQN